jgi:hypothetical protein
MAKYKEKIVNATTGEETFRDYTAAEVAEVEAAIIEGATRAAEFEAKAAVRASALAKLAALGLTETEIAAL